MTQPDPSNPLSFLPSPARTLVSGIVQHLATAAGAALVSDGVLTQKGGVEFADVAAGLVFAGLAWAWAQWQHNQHHNQAVAAVKVAQSGTGS